MTHLKIIQLTARRFDITTAELMSRDKKIRFAKPRMMAQKLCRDLMRLSFNAIGRIFNRHHTSVIFAVKVIQNECDTNPQIAAQFHSLKEALK